MNICPVICSNCGKEWLESYENLEAIESGEHACRLHASFSAVNGLTYVYNGINLLKAFK